MTLSTLQTHNATDGAGVARWTEEHDELLKAEWAKGTPAREIAALLTAQGFPQTKNGILGRAHRKRLPRHENAHEPVVKKAPVDLTKPTGCRWIDGDAAGWQSKWCDAPLADPAESWCEVHRSIVFRPRTEAEVQAAAGVYKNKRAA